MINENLYQLQSSEAPNEIKTASDEMEYFQNIIKGNKKKLYEISEIRVADKCTHTRHSSFASRISNRIINEEILEDKGKWTTDKFDSRWFISESTFDIRVYFYSKSFYLGDWKSDKEYLIQIVIRNKEDPFE